MCKKISQILNIHRKLPIQSMACHMLLKEFGREKELTLMRLSQHNAEMHQKSPQTRGYSAQEKRKNLENGGSLKNNGGYGLRR